MSTHLSHCPRCQENLKPTSQNGQDFLLCPRGDGILLPLKSFQTRTSRSFVQQFWNYWRQLKHSQSFPCPVCGTRTETLSKDTNAKLILDCCPQCFSLWLDTGEDEQLQNFFLNQYLGLEKDVKAQKLHEDEVNLMAKFVLEHEKTNQRFDRMSKFGDFLSQQVRPFHRFRGIFKY